MSGIAKRWWPFSFVIFGIAIVALIVVVAIVTSNGPTFAHQANLACRGHNGVKQIDSDNEVAVCRDGYVGDIDY